MFALELNRHVLGSCDIEVIVHRMTLRLGGAGAETCPAITGTVAHIHDPNFSRYDFRWTTFLGAFFGRASARSRRGCVLQETSVHPRLAGRCEMSPTFRAWPTDDFQCPHLSAPSSDASKLRLAAPRCRCNGIRTPMAAPRRDGHVDDVRPH